LLIEGGFVAKGPETARRQIDEQLFLNLHNAELRATDAQVVETIEGVAGGMISVEELISFFEAHTRVDG
jgi:hypothetical protein